MGFVGEGRGDAGGVDAGRGDGDVWAAAGGGAGIRGVGRGLDVGWGDAGGRAAAGAAAGGGGGDRCGRAAVARDVRRGADAGRRVGSHVAHGEAADFSFFRNYRDSGF